MHGSEAVRAEKGFILFISNEDMDDIIRIKKIHQKVTRKFKCIKGTLMQI